LGITSAQLRAPDYALLCKQHEAYIQSLRSLGLEVIALEALSNYPDAYFVEDVAVVTPEVAVITNPGAAPRKGEEEQIEPVLKKYRQLERIRPPGTLEGGDVLMAGSHFVIGISERTNREGANQLGQILHKFGYSWSTIGVKAGLHLKSSVNYVGKNTLLITEDLADQDAFSDYEKIVLERGEEYAGNTLLINDHLIMPKGFPKTKKKLLAVGYEIIELDVSEVQKMDGGLTCMSLRF
jgi:dimethylargininase